MLQQADYNCIGIVAKHCDNTKLCVAENEALKFDLSELFCGEWTDVLAIWEEVNEYLALVAACEATEGCNPELIPAPDDYEFKRKLVFGGDYIGCSGKTRPFGGLKELLTYYSFSRYIMLNEFNDTPTGLVQKTNEFSIPIEYKKLTNFADKYRTMGYTTFEKISGYLCANNTSVFTWWTACAKCVCGSEQCGGTKAKGYGFKSSIITKRI